MGTLYPETSSVILIRANARPSPFDLTWVNEYAAGLDLALRDRTDDRA